MKATILKEIDISFCWDSANVRVSPFDAPSDVLKLQGLHVQWDRQSREKVLATFGLLYDSGL